MADGDEKRKLGKRSSKMFAFVFLVLLAMPLTTIPFSMSSERVSERRLAAAYPSLFESFREYPQAFEKWFEDHFGLRSTMIRFYRQTRFELGLFDSNAQVVEGKDDWLFLSGGGEGDPLLAYSGAIGFEESELDQLKLYFQKWKSWLDHRGISFLVLVAPNKVSVYPEHAPDGLPRSPYGTRTDQFLQRIKKTDVTVLFPIEALIEMKAEGSDLYYKLDTHWNVKGAFAVYRELARSLPGSSRFLETDFRFDENRRVGGDLSAMLGVESDWMDFEYRVALTKGEWASSEGEWAPVGNPRREFSMGDSELPKALVVHDSFMEPIGGLLARHFSNATFSSERALRSDLILETRPDLVILEFTERTLHTYLKEALPQE